MKISEQNEGTSFPFWVIIDPRQNFKTDNQGLHNIASMVTGVWLSREAAQEFLDRTRYNFSEHARVFCHSGCYSQDWIELSKELNKQIKMKNEIEEIKDLIEQAQERLAKLEGKPEFKDGDVVFGKTTEAIAIFSEADENGFFKAKAYFAGAFSDCNTPFYSGNFRLATPEEAQILFDALAKDGKKWNAETKQIEPLQPEFKAGDFVRRDDRPHFCIISEVFDNSIFEVIGTTPEIHTRSAIPFFSMNRQPIRHMTETEKAEFLEMIRKAGYQYNPETNTCTKLRWREEKYGRYWFVYSDFKPISAVEENYSIDDHRFNAGNYFQTKAECQAFCDKVKELVK